MQGARRRAALPICALIAGAPPQDGAKAAEAEELDPVKKAKEEKARADATDGHAVALQQL